MEIRQTPGRINSDKSGLMMQIMQYKSQTCCKDWIVSVRVRENATDEDVQDRIKLY